MEDEPSTQEVIDLLEIVRAIEYSKSACCLISLNVRSLLVHASDIAADPIIKMDDILALSETAQVTISTNNKPLISIIDAYMRYNSTTNAYTPYNSTSAA